MKILMVSIFAPHFFNWTQQLKDSGYEVYWLDVFDSHTHVPQIDFVEQIIGWRYKKDFKGRYFLKKKYPSINKLINRFNERDFAEFFEEKLNEIQPDVVHSFVMQLACIPILDIMENNPKIKWVYSAWGSDLFFYQKRERDIAEITQVLKRIDYLFTDCKRDFKIADSNGFGGIYLGNFPGGGGFKIDLYESENHTFENRNIILIKGYQGKHGRCIEVLKALNLIKDMLVGFEIVVFGAANEVYNYISSGENQLDNLVVKPKINFEEVIKLLGKSIIYIGNSMSDGTPNTLLEAIIMDVFPIQSDPGGATAEIIEHKKNGLLISKPENIEHIKNTLLISIRDKELLKTGIGYNRKIIKPKLDREYIKMQVLEKYRLIESQL